MRRVQLVREEWRLGAKAVNKGLNEESVEVKESANEIGG